MLTLPLFLLETEIHAAKDDTGKETGKNVIHRHAPTFSKRLGVINGPRFPYIE